MKNAISKLLIGALSLALLIYSGLRSLDFIQATLPADKQILAFFALAATEGGLLFWLLHFRISARGSWQKGIALLMVGIDFLGSAALFTLDTLYRSGEMGLTVALTGDEIRAAVLALSGIITVNVGAAILTEILDPAHLLKMAEDESRDRIESAALDAISKDAPLLAAELAPQLSADWVAKTRAKYTAALGLPAGKIIEGAPLKDAPGLPSARPARSWRSYTRRPMFSKNTDTVTPPDLENSPNERREA